MPKAIYHRFDKRTGLPVPMVRIVADSLVFSCDIQVPEKHACLELRKIKRIVKNYVNSRSEKKYNWRGRCYEVIRPHVPLSVTIQTI